MTLVLAVILPTIIISVAGTVMLWRSAQRAAEQDLTQRAEALASVIDLQLETAKATLNILAISHSLLAGDLEDFRRLVIDASLPEGGRIMLSDQDGRMVVTSNHPFGMKLPLRQGGAIARQIFATGTPMVSNLYLGGTSQKLAIAIDVPVFKDGRVVYDLAMALPPALFGHLLEQQRPPNSDWIAAIVDGANSIVARVPGLDRYAGQKGTAASQRMVDDPAVSGSFSSIALDGQFTLTAYRRVPGTAWVTAVALHWSAVNIRLWTQLLAIAGVGLALLLAGLAASLYQARRIAKSIGGLVAHPPSGVPNGLREVDVVARTLADAAAQRARSEAALRESEARFRVITDTMPQIVWSARPDGCNDYYNNRWYELTKTKPGEIEGDAWREMFHPADSERAWTRWQRALATGEPYEVEHRLRLPDGRYRWLLTRAVPVRDPATGAITRWFGTSTDIEETVAAREALARSREELERLVTERTRDLQETQSRLAQARRMEALGQLAGGIAHDFNNVLQAVQGGTTLIDQRPGDPGRVQRLARMVLQAAERGAAITSRLLTFSHRGDLRAEAVDAELLLTGLREMLSHTLGAGIDVRVDLPPLLPPLLVDRGQLETVLVNLATNARDAMSGYGTLTLTAAEQILGDDAPGHPGRLDPGRYILLRVADTGIGMDAATLARASEPFFTTKPVGKGTGLGLTMVHGFAEQSRGGMHIDSVPGHGTAVSLWFPVATGEAAEPHTAAPLFDPSRASTGRAQVMLVDDDPVVREVLAEQLEAVGFAVLAAESADAGLALLDSGVGADILVSDLSMPGLDGMALIREAQHRRPGLPAVLLTGFVSDAAEIAVAGAISGTFSLLRKPVDAATLAERIATLLEAAPPSGARTWAAAR